MKKKKDINTTQLVFSAIVMVMVQEASTLHLMHFISTFDSLSTKIIVVSILWIHFWFRITLFMNISWVAITNGKQWLSSVQCGFYCFSILEGGLKKLSGGSCWQEVWLSQTPIPTLLLSGCQINPGQRLWEYQISHLWVSSELVSTAAYSSVHCFMSPVTVMQFINLLDISVVDYF